MQEIRLFEIPIYSMKESEYKNRCYNYINKMASKTIPDNYKDFYAYLENAYYKRRPWKYNQIIGYIEIVFKDNSIWFNEYRTLDSRIRAIADKKHIINNMFLSGYHFYVKSTMSNDEIKNEILKWINSIEKEILPKPLYLDKEMFLLQLTNIDIKKMLGSDY